MIYCNVIAIDFKALKEDVTVASGDPVFCEDCQAVFNVHSKIEEVKGSQIWKCEFCGHPNEVNLDKEEMPTKDTINYLVDRDEEEKKSVEDSSIIFCIDVSGSMNKGNEMMNPARKALMNRMSAPYLKDTSRLTNIKTGIISQLQALKESQNIVGLILFSECVNLIGDGADSKFSFVEKEDLNDYSKLCEFGKKFAKVRMTQNISETYQKLESHVLNLHGSGKTALGPAAVIATSAASKLGAGSKVIICTDGLSNVGIGNLQDLAKGIVKQDEIDVFYNKLATFANESGVIIDLISLKGEECDLETLITLSEKTGGNVDIINPDDVKHKLKNLIFKETIATKVCVKIHLHKALEFRNENPIQLNKDRTQLTKKLGSINEDSEITFEYKFKNQSELSKLSGFNIDEFDQVPFQIVIEYSTPNGMKCLRVITNVQKTNDDLNEVQKDVKVEILASNAAHQATKIARAGNFREAQAYSMKQKKLILSNARSDKQQKMYAAWKGSMNDIYNNMHIQNNLEERVQISSVVKGKSGVALKTNKRGYLSKANDNFINYMNKGMNINSRAFV